MVPWQAVRRLSSEDVEAVFDGGETGSTGKDAEVEVRYNAVKGIFANLKAANDNVAAEQVALAA